jgi:hypothetical protein
LRKVTLYFGKVYRSSAREWRRLAGTKGGKRRRERRRERMMGSSSKGGIEPRGKVRVPGLCGAG